MSVSLSKHPAPTACPAPGGPHSGPAEETGTRTVAAITTAFPLSGIAHTAPDAVAGVVVSVAPDGSGWERLSAAFTDEAPILAERDDLTVVIAPGAGQGAPACLLPAQARIEIDGTHLGVDPATADPARPARPLPLPDRLGAVRARMRPRPPHRLEPHPRRPTRRRPCRACCWRSPASRPRIPAAAPTIGTGYAPPPPTSSSPTSPRPRPARRPHPTRHPARRPTPRPHRRVTDSLPAPPTRVPLAALDALTTPAGGLPDRLLPR